MTAWLMNERSLLTFTTRWDLSFGAAVSLVTSGPDLLFLKDYGWRRQGRHSLSDPPRLGNVGHAPCGEQPDLRS